MMHTIDETREELYQALCEAREEEVLAWPE